jgi:hypothetical protein
LFVLFNAIQGLPELLGAIQCVVLTPVCIVKGLTNFVPKQMLCFKYVGTNSGFFQKGFNPFRPYSHRKYSLPAIT